MTLRGNQNTWMRNVPAGRPTDYNVEFCKTAHAMAQQGATIREIAQAFDVNELTVYRWQHKYPEFRKSIELGKDAADSRVENSLYNRAVGYSYDAIKIQQYEGIPVITPYVEHVPPDVNAAAIWLKNRQPDKWRDKQEVAHTGVLAVTNITDEQLAEIARRAINPTPA